MSRFATVVTAVGVPAASDRVETLRGVACILLVAFHVVGGDVLHGIRVTDSSEYRTFTTFFMHLRMPLFTFLSGFVYAYKPVSDTGTFVTDKLKRLLVPFLIVSTIYFLLHRLTPGTNTKVPWEQMWTIYLFPYHHFWFLQAIMLLFGALAVLERYRLLQSFARFLGVMTVTLALHFFVRLPVDLFSIDHALYLAPFFLAGVGANRFHVRLWDPRVKYSMLLILVTTITLHTLATLGQYGTVAEPRTFTATALGLSELFALMYFTPRVRWLSWIGGFSFAIYLHHVFFTAGIRIFLHRIELTNLEGHFVLGCVLGLLGPVVFVSMVKNNAIARRALLGQWRDVTRRLANGRGELRPSEDRAQMRTPGTRKLAES
jgi:surface polysaccharide O-acyltransferase-like enzyme